MEIDTDKLLDITDEVLLLFRERIQNIEKMLQYDSVKTFLEKEPAGFYWEMWGGNTAYAQMNYVNSLQMDLLIMRYWEEEINRTDAECAINKFHILMEELEGVCRSTNDNHDDCTEPTIEEGDERITTAMEHLAYSIPNVWAPILEILLEQKTVNGTHHRQD